ncbi:MAG: hypothetical protein L0Y54_07290, partial [Sporichthyaceae bacterium]|nr:hypothetical protein [Sporichthyaceae bacterium]
MPEPDRSPDSQRAPTPDPYSVGRTDVDVVPGDPPVPITVWRVAQSPSDDADPAETGLSYRLACRLLAHYSLRDQTVADLDDDPRIRAAAQRLGRRYLGAAELATGTAPAGEVSLVMLRWPRPHRASPTVADLFAGCRGLRVGDGCASVAVPAVPTGPPAPRYLDHARILVPAARSAGLGYLQHIIAVTAPLEADRFTYHASVGEAQAIRA